MPTGILSGLELISARHPVPGRPPIPARPASAGVAGQRRGSVRSLLGVPGRGAQPGPRPARVDRTCQWPPGRLRTESPVARSSDSWPGAARPGRVLRIIPKTQCSEAGTRDTVTWNTQ